MKPDITTAIHSLAPGAQWQLIGTEYSGLNWINGNGYKKPTEQEIQNELERLLQEYPKTVVQQQRAIAYSQESDPLFFKYQAGEISKEDWLIKREEIRTRYPYPA